MITNNTWKTELKEAYTNIRTVFKKLNTSIPEELLNVEKQYPILITDYYFNLIDRSNIQNDPIWKQCMPSPDEINKYYISQEDPLSEEIQMPVPKLIHRYKDRAVLLTSSRCSMQCRFCFRKRYWKNGTQRLDISNRELDSICNYIKSQPDLNEILISGGDPLILETSRLKYILDKLTGIKNIEIVRIASRVPVTLPNRIDYELVEMLSKYEGLWFVTHFNHPQEITKKSIEACKFIISKGIPILNQTVLLKGINDSSATLEHLFRQLIKIKIKPHYLFHVDPVKGVKHFATGIKCGLDILKDFQLNLSSIAVPHFAIDLPAGGGKISLQPDYCSDSGFKGINNKIIPYYPEL